MIYYIYATLRAVIKMTTLREYGNTRDEQLINAILEDPRGNLEDGNTNAKDEFLYHTQNRPIRCAMVRYGDSYIESNNKVYLLKQGYTQQDLNTFLASLDFGYDSGFGRQELFGVIWYSDGTWSDRGEYDGSEWWEHHLCPDIPDELK